MEHPIGALPRTPFCHYVAFPLKGKREIWREKQGVIYFMYHSGVSPFGGCRHHLARWEACHMTQKGQSRNADFILIARKGDTTTLGPKGRQT